MATAAQSARRKKAFLQHFAVMGNVTRACQAAGVGRRTVYDWQEQDEAFVQAFRQAEIESTEVLEAEAFRRAHDGVARELPIFYQGEVVGSRVERQYSDVLLIFLLKARNPAKYRERVQMQHANADGGRLPLGAVEEYVRHVLAAKDRANG